MVAEKQKTDIIITQLLERCEIHRKGLALLPDQADKRPGLAFLVFNEFNSAGEISCSCRITGKGACTHIADLKRVYASLDKDRPFDHEFRNGIWYQIASILMDGKGVSLENISLKKISRKTGHIIIAKDNDKNELMRYFAGNHDAERLVERCIGLPKEANETIVPTRNLILNKLYKKTQTLNERIMLDRGFKTRGQILEESFWFRMAYHAWRELGNVDFLMTPAIDKKTGAFTVICKNREDNPVMSFSVPRKVVKKLLVTFRQLLPNQNSMPIQPVPLKSIFNIDINTELDLEVRPVIEVIQKNGERSLFKRENLEQFTYGDLMYIPELGIMTELETPGRERKFKAPVKMVLKKSQIPEFLDEYGDELFNESNIISDQVRAIRIIKDYEGVEIVPEAIDRDWCWLSIRYRFGNSDISLSDILRSAREGHRYIGIDRGWIDTGTSEIQQIRDYFSKIDPGDADRLRLSRMDLLRLNFTGRNITVNRDNSETATIFKRIMELKPSQPFKAPKGLKSELRHYQKIGVEWLFYLYENSFGGLLCDDMGLGKTHQIMAFLLGLREQQGVTAPFLVVCPTTVLSHWEIKIREHAPSLKGVIYHGSDRDLDSALEGKNLIITSYGVLARDIKKLKNIPFAVAVFDEIQHIKNPETLAYKAASGIMAGMKTGLTGTPIENRLEELKTLFDLTVPGYLRSDASFYARYITPIQEHKDKKLQEELAKVISPFTLRRLKKSVLDELPDKIENILSCTLSNHQIRLYRDAVNSRGSGLLASLENRDEPVPYIHIFALLNLLKQVCNHPALVEKVPEKYEEYESGKWELFKEILGEALESGNKVVVYSQYLEMIGIMKRYLLKEGIGHVALTGKSRKRGDIVKSFSNDPDCRVFIGSLRAGGVGIDLIAASVVIHYDRWWNAAKEDQATDRVHRIGQKRGVQVFKLVTEGTLEEKISAIINRKKDLMESVIKEDDPALLKGFSREDLMELIRF